MITVGEILRRVFCSLSRLPGDAEEGPPCDPGITKQTAGNTNTQNLRSGGADVSKRRSATLDTAMTSQPYLILIGWIQHASATLWKGPMRHISLSS